MSPSRPHFDRHICSFRTWAILRFPWFVCRPEMPPDASLAVIELAPLRCSSSSSLERTVSSSAFRSRLHVSSSNSCRRLASTLRWHRGVTLGGSTILDVLTHSCSIVWCGLPTLSTWTSPSSPLSTMIVRLALFPRHRAAAIFAETGSTSSGSVATLVRLKSISSVPNAFVPPVSTSSATCLTVSATCILP